MQMKENLTISKELKHFKDSFYSSEGVIIWEETHCQVRLNLLFDQGNLAGVIGALTHDSECTGECNLKNKN